MIISPPINTNERQTHDLHDLKKIFQYCRSIGISKDIEIRKNICTLKEFAGKESFLELFANFFKLIEKKQMAHYNNEVPEIY